MRLNCEDDSPDMGERVERAAASKFDLDDKAVLSHRVFFEHGQWWLYILYEAWDDRDEEAYAIVDVEGGESVDGFDFERVT